MSSIIARRSAVERIARSFGYSVERAEDIAQEAALRLIANPNLASQSAKQAFIDVIRVRREGMYSRSGRVHQPVFESAFEDYASFINGIGSGDDLESRAITRSELSDAVSCLPVLKPNYRLALEMYAEGSSLAEISQRLRCTESRVSQLLKVSRIEIKKAVISKSLSRQKQRQREWRQSQPISREIQARPGIQRKVAPELGSFFCKPIQGMVSFKVPKVPESLFRSF